MDRHDSDKERNPGVAHEPNQVNLLSIVAFGCFLLIAVLIYHLWLWQLLRGFSDRADEQEGRPNPLLGLRDRYPPEPRLQGLPGHQSLPLLDIQEYRAAEDAVLGSYGWVDRRAGVVRIPISRAMELLGTRGLPSRAAGGQGGGSMPQQLVPSVSSGGKTLTRWP